MNLGLAPADAAATAWVLASATLGVPTLAFVAFSMTGTALIGGLVNRVAGSRLRPREEATGMDLSQHGESAHEIGALATSTRAAVRVPAMPAGPTVPTQTSASRR